MIEVLANGGNHIATYKRNRPTRFIPKCYTSTVSQ